MFYICFRRITTLLVNVLIPNLVFRLDFFVDTIWTVTH
jgi:hypothetical protein